MESGRQDRRGVGDKRYAGEDKRQDAARKAAQRAQVPPVTAADALETFRTNTVYANVFPCICCTQIHFEKDVVVATDVSTFGTLAGLGRFCQEEHLSDHRFLCQGVLWCCRKCKEHIDAGRLPPMASKNNLDTPWALESNSCLTDLKSVEREALATLHPFQKVGCLCCDCGCT